MQATIYAQQSQLKQSQDQINQLKAENARLLATTQGSGGRARVGMGDSSDIKKVGGINDRGYNIGTSYSGDLGRCSTSGGFVGKRRDDDTSAWRGGGGGRGEKFCRYDNGSSSRTWEDRGGAGRADRSLRGNRGTDRTGRSSRDSPDRGRDTSYRRNRTPEHHDRQNRSPDNHKMPEKRRRRDSTPDVKRAPSVGDRESRDRTDIRNHDIRRKSKDAHTSEEGQRKRVGSPGEGSSVRDVGMRSQQSDEVRTSELRNGDKDSGRNFSDGREPKKNCAEPTTVKNVDEDHMGARKVDQPRTSPVQAGNNLSDSSAVPANGVQCALNGLSLLSGERLESDESLKTAVR